MDFSSFLYKKSIQRVLTLHGQSFTNPLDKFLWISAILFLFDALSSSIFSRLIRNVGGN